MTGYQESVTDPSYAGQIIVFTYPMIGNYGVSRRGDGIGRPTLAGVVVREPTYGRTRHRRGRLARLARRSAAFPESAASTRAPWCATSATEGAMRGGIFPAATPGDGGARTRSPPSR